MSVQVEFNTVNVNLKPKPQTSLEAQARDARYQALQSVNTVPFVNFNGTS